MGPSNLNSGASISRAFAAAATILVLLLPQGASAQEMRHPQHQPQNRLQGVPPSQFIPCASIGEPLIRVPELRAQGGKLRGTIVLSTQATRMNLALGPTKSVPQFVRAFQGVNAVLPDYPGMIPPGFPNAGQPTPPSQYPDPVPGPTLRARVGDIVRADFSQPGRRRCLLGLDRPRRERPGLRRKLRRHATRGLDTFPGLLPRSSTGNIHFHGTHTNPPRPATTCFVEVRPSLRDKRASRSSPRRACSRPFDEFFAECEMELNKSVLSQWPYEAGAICRPAGSTRQIELLQRYDSDPAIKNKLLPIDLAQRAAGAWPQYYIGAYPYCFRLPHYVARRCRRSRRARRAHVAMMSMACGQGRALQMGQSPGTHWYHAHKHGSTTINVANGMTGAFIIEGDIRRRAQQLLRLRLDRPAVLDARAAGAGDQPAGREPEPVRRRQRPGGRCRSRSTAGSSR